MTVDVEQHPREAVRDVARPRSWTPFGVVIVLFLMAILAASVAGHPRIAASREAPGPLPLPQVEPTRIPTTSPSSLDTGDGELALLIIGIVLAVLVSSLLVLGLILLARRLVQAWRDRPLRRQDAAETDVEVAATELLADAVPDAPTIRRGISAARTMIERHNAPGDAIIAAWVGLEETAADSGVGRGRSETPSEFTLRILLHRPGIDGPVHSLLALYERVRFGGHVASEQDRKEAADALRAIEERWR